jgi:hypothetical protein|tara:strand:+ start:4942 stop:5145 length:204 start_codon:yes stop_codon:yes gene_type:complete
MAIASHLTDTVPHHPKCPDCERLMVVNVTCTETCHHCGFQETSEYDVVFDQQPSLLKKIVKWIKAVT